MREVFKVISKRDDKLCNFVEGGPWGDGTRIVYRCVYTPQRASVRCIFLSFLSHFLSFLPARAASPPVITSNLSQIEPHNTRKGRFLVELNATPRMIRHYATLYFIFCVDDSESELGILDLIQVFVESPDRWFENVCELDLVFHMDRVR